MTLIEASFLSALMVMIADRSCGNKLSSAHLTHIPFLVFLEISHHLALLLALNWPEILVVTATYCSLLSCGPNNDYNHPHQETLQRLYDNNCRVYRTDIGGTICVTCDGKKIQVKYLSVLLDGNKR